MDNNFSARMTAIETHMTGFERRMTSVEQKMDNVVGRLEEFISTAARMTAQPKFDPHKILSFLVYGASLFGLVATGIIYIAASQSAANISVLQTRQDDLRSEVRSLVNLYHDESLRELRELRSQRSNWQAKTAAQ